MSSAPAFGPTTDSGHPGACSVPPTDPFVPGETLDGRYLLLDQIGRGTSSSVWRARDEILRRDVAIKRLVGDPGWSPAQADAARVRAQREGMVAARLHHHHVAAIYDLVEVAGDICLVMELVDAPPMSRLVDGHGPLEPAAAAHVGFQIAAGLAAAHAAGVLHRDVKPANVLVAADGSASLTDFGVARLVDDTAATTASGRLTGTPHFMAPEIAQGAPATAASDVYALGATLFFAVEGQPPTGHGPSALETLRRVAAGQNLPMHRAGPLAPALARLLDRDPAARPAAAEVGALLRSVASQAESPSRTRPVDRASEHPRTLVGRPVTDGGAPPATNPVSRRAVTPLAAVTPAAVRPRALRAPADRTRRRRVAVGSVLGVAGLAGAVGGVLAVSHASTTPLAAAASVPQVEAPVVPPVVPASAPPITPAPEPPITDLGPTIEPPAPALVVAAVPADTSYDSSADRASNDDDHSDGRGKHRKHDKGSDDEGGKHHKKDSDGDQGKKKDKDKGHDDKGSDD